MTISKSEDTSSASPAASSSLYDYVIVGAGSAGCVLANRLTEDPDVRVLVMDAGPDPYNGETNANIRERLEQLVHFQELQDSDVDWRYLTQPQPYLNMRQIFTPRGKLVGGTGCFGAGLYVRGNAEDYDGWVRMGNEGWSYKEVLPYFKKAENNQREGIDPELHGKNGPVAVSDTDPINPATEIFIKVCEKLGHRRTADLNTPNQEGVGTYQALFKDRRRVHSLSAYLTDDVRARPNLQIKSLCHATNLIIEDGRAIGVRYEDSSNRHRVTTDVVYARQEVIVSCGAIDSPKLLMLSGIGPKAELRQHGINVIVDLPGVGKNYQDHPIISLAFFYKDGKKSLPPAGYGIEGALFDKSPGVNFPDIQFVFVHMLVGPPGPLIPDGFMLVPTLVEGHSRGELKLASAYPHDAPLIQPYFLSKEEDMDRMVWGLKKAIDIMYDEAFDGIRGGPVLPGHPDRSADDEAIKAYIRLNAATLYHPAGTCRMGPNPHDPAASAVVDSRLRVHYIQGLRVIDASVMPQIVRGNPQNPTIMIAEKAADMIKQDRVQSAGNLGQGGLTVTAWLTVLDGKLEEFKRRQAEFVATPQLGLRQFQVFTDPTEENRFLWIQVWESAAALEASHSTPAHTDLFLGKIIPLVGTPKGLNRWRPN